jgi:hypothetical protein
LVYYLDPIILRIYKLFLYFYKNITVFCYEIFKKWLILGLFAVSFRNKHPLFHLIIILEPYIIVLGYFPFDIQPYRNMSDYLILIFAIPISKSLW